MRSQIRLTIGAAMVGLLLFLPGDDLSAGRGGGGRGGGGGGFGGGRPAGFGGGYGRPMPMPSPRPMPPAGRPNPGPGRPNTGPNYGGGPNRNFNQPTWGINIGSPEGGAISGGSPSTLPSPGTGAGPGSGSVLGGGGNRGSIGEGRPSTGPARPAGGAGVARPGTGAGVRPGTGAGSGRTGIANGAIDGGLGNASRSVAASARNRTVSVSQNTLFRQGSSIRKNFNHWDCFHGRWWDRFPGCWRNRGWLAAGVVWALPGWDVCYPYVGYPEDPIYYDYGTNVVYQDDGVYVNGEQTATAAEYADQAQQYADTGRDAMVSQEGDWLPLGVFAMAQEGGSVSNNLFQFAVNKEGILRGNYYNGLADTAEPLYGSVDKKTQRAAWTVGDKKNVVYETSLANLTKNETTMLVHTGKDKTQQWTLVRMEQPKD